MQSLIISCVSLALALTAAGLVTHDYLWTRAYNRGFAFAKANPNINSDSNWTPFANSRFKFIRKAFNLGARHAKGY